MANRFAHDLDYAQLVDVRVPVIYSLHRLPLRADLVGEPIRGGPDMSYTT